MVDRSKTRSSGYQHVIIESPCSPDKLTEFSDAQGVTGIVNSSSHNEELLDLEEQLISEFWRIVDSCLTPRQSQVLKLYAKDMTQIEIAKQLNVNQSSITKSINGNCDYRNGKKSYGGSRRKILKAAAHDVRIQEIFRRIAEIKREM